MINIDKYLKLMNLTKLTAIQEKCIEPIYNAESVFALAPTGSGKTMAFLLPLLLKLDTSIRSPQVIILVPTRELGMQIANVAQNIANCLLEAEQKNILIRSVFGGTAISAQILEMQKNPHVIIATPGRMIDLLQRESIETNQLKTLILDEADIMVGMGFADQIEEIVNYVPSHLQIGFFSATQNEKITELEKLFLKNVKFVKIDLREKIVSSDKNLIKHEYLVTKKDEKKDKLIQILSSEHFNKGIIFCHTRETVQNLVTEMKQHGLNIDGLTGELGQVHRNSIMRNFKTGNLKFLVATNIAARGIDVSLLPIVIHYDIPYQNDEYVHRSGRTGRAGHSGLSLALCEEKNVNYYLNMMKELQIECSEFKKENLSKKIQKEVSSKVEKVKNDIKFIKVFINKGKKEKIRPADIVGSLIKELNLEKEDIGNIFIFDHFTHVEINSKKYSEKKAIKVKIKNMLASVTIAK
ncbi:DEAD/DEAH box helicase [Pigmentibacter ruber]|uniref:DEAD/DEAH box helicase n=1 Tax=Pigmentibacter ruber TaxID=2683196 RepID=UPI00131B8F42|nr:DEAD/DEAH box helicase [Pigmentibacter ruber]